GGAAVKLKATSAAGAVVEGNFGANFVELGLMRFDVLPGAEHALLLAGPECEANGAARNEAGGFDRAGRFDDERRVAAVVQRAGAEFPGIQMRAQDHRLVGLFVAANLADDIELIDRAADFVGHGEARADFTGTGSDRAGQPEGIFARENSLGDYIEGIFADV